MGNKNRRKRRYPTEQHKYPTDDYMDTPDSDEWTEGWVRWWRKTFPNQDGIPPEDKEDE